MNEYDLSQNLPLALRHVQAALDSLNRVPLTVGSVHTAIQFCQQASSFLSDAQIDLLGITINPINPTKP